MITFIRPLAAGNAVALQLALAAGALYQRILRNTADAFAGPNDPAAVLVVDSCVEPAIVDTTDLANGVPMFYRAFDWDGSTWIDQGVSFPATPSATYIDDTLDPQEILRDRVQLGISEEVARGNLKPPSGAIQVTTAPFGLADGFTFPTISVHLESTGPADRALGDELADTPDPVANNWVGSEGWFARFSMSVAAVSLNSDERIALRKALRRVIQVNLPVFSAAGMMQIDFQQTDSEQFSENNAPLYFTSGAFSCLAPVFVRETADSIVDVTLSLTNP